MIRRILGWALLALLVLAGAAGYLGYRYLASGQPRLDGFVHLQGLGAPVQVYRDARGVPHIFAESEVDLYRATGYVMAQDRLFQMDLTRRIAQGRLAEVLGEELLEIDLAHRVYGFDVQARRGAAEADAITRRVLEAFSEGVNACIAGSEALPPEFRLLGYAPEPWKPEHSIGLARLIGWGLGERLELERLTLQLRARLGDALAARLVPDDLALAEAPLVPDPEGIDPRPRFGFAPLPADLLEALRASAPASRPASGEGGGSNSWVVAAERSATGRPLLANDPHLALSQPSFWYLIHQQIPGELDVIGGAIPGTPTVLIGRNRQIAWGLTNVGADFQDLFLERLDPPDAPTRYATPEGWAELTRREEAIVFVDGAGERQTRTEVILETAHGPLLPERPAPGYGLALKWSGGGCSDELLALYRLNRAEDLDGFHEALADFGVPPQNIVFASADGTVGFQTVGFIPRRKGFDGRGPVPGFSGEYGWLGRVPYEVLPRGKAPEEGFYAIANQAPVGRGYPFEITTSADPPHRAARIRQRLQAETTADLSLMQSMQMDDTSVQAPAVRDRLVAAVEAGGAVGGVEAAALELLRGWDLRFARDSAGALIYQTAYRELCRALLYDELGDLYEGYARHTFVLPQVAERELADPTSPFIDDRATPDRQETADDLYRTAFRRGVALLRESAGEDPAAWRWDAFHLFPRRHPLGRGSALADLIFSRGPDDVAGSMWTPNATSAKLDPFGPVRAGPSLRMIVDFSEDAGVHLVITGGQSGHPLSPHYDDLTPLWLHGDLLEIPMDRERVRLNTRHRLVLKPEGE